MKKTKQIKLDNIQFKKTKQETVDAAELFLRRRQSQTGPVLFSRGKVTQHFFTEDSKLYITPREQALLDKGARLNRKGKQWDALNSRIARTYRAQKAVQSSQTDWLLNELEKRAMKFNEDLQSASTSFMGQFSMARLWNMSIVGAILVGMFSMSMIYRYLGQGAAAGVTVQSAPVATQLVLVGDAQAQVLDAGATNDEQLAELSDEQISQQEFEERLRAMVKGYPIEKMVPYILKKDRKTAAYLVAIAKKESAWGVHSPVLNGQDCYNYWGYRGQRKLMGTGGHTCFNSREDAVDTVGKRINNLVNEQNLDTAAELIVWKCGSTCAGHGAYNVQKWISDVDMYYQKLNMEEKK